MEPTVCSVSRTAVNEFLQQLNTFREENVLCDVTIIVDGESFPCHRNVLCSSSEYFKTMFLSQFNENTKAQIEMQDIDAGVFKQILNFVYVGRITINEENVSSLLITSEYLGLKYIEDLCLSYIEESLPMNNIAALLLFATKTGKTRLSERLYEHVATNFSNLAKTNELMQFPVDIMKKILLHPKLRGSDPGASRNFLSEWLKTQPELIEKFVGNLKLNCLVDIVIKDANELSKGATKLVIESNPAIPNKLQCLKLITSEYSEIGDDLPTFRLSARKLVSQANTCLERRFIEEGTNFTHCKSVFLDEQIMYNYVRNDAWTKMLAWNVSSGCGEGYWTALDSAYNFRNVIAAPVRRSIYFYDYDEHDCDKCALVSYECEKDEFVRHEPYENFVPVSQPCMVSRDESVYLVGGRDRTIHSEGLLQHLDSRTPRWNRLPDSLYKHIDASACLHNGKIYVSGGNHLSYLKKVVERFDLVANKWEALAPMSRRKMNHILVPLDHCIYAIGGSVKDVFDPASKVHNDFSICVYSVATNEWINSFTINDTSNEGFKISAILDAVVF